MKLIIANWKMNPATVEEAVVLARDIDASNLVIASPFPFIPAVCAAVSHAKLGAQDLAIEDSGPFTGEVSGSQLVSIGVTYSIVGHSERRKLGETDEIVGAKTAAALFSGLVPIVCVGETMDERRVGVSESAVERELGAVIESVRNAAPKTQEIIVAYEPLWAISTEPDSKPDTPDSAATMIRFIQELWNRASLQSFQLRTIYGGSLNAANAAGFLSQPDIEGALVGGASLKSDELKLILNAAL